MMKKWVNVTDSFSEEERHYKDLYLEIDEVFDGIVEVSLFSSKKDQYELYISFEILYGIIYADKESAALKREEVKKELEQEYLEHKEPTSDFINEFAEKHGLCMPNDIFFNAPDFFDI